MCVDKVAEYWSRKMKPLTQDELDELNRGKWIVKVEGKTFGKAVEAGSTCP